MRRGQRGGSPAKTAKQKILEGNPGKGKINKNEPEGKGNLGFPPDYFNDAQREIWAEVVSLIPDYIATNSDSVVVEVLVNALSKLRAGEFNTALCAEIRRGCSELCMSPTSRATMKVPEKDDNPFSALMN